MMKPDYHINFEAFHQYYYANKSTTHEPVPHLLFMILEKAKPPKGYSVEKEDLLGLKCLRIKNPLDQSVIVYKQPMLDVVPRACRGKAYDGPAFDPIEDSYADDQIIIPQEMHSISTYHHIPDRFSRDAHLIKAGPIKYPPNIKNTTKEYPMKKYDVLDEYQSHKTVKAAKIKKINFRPDGSATIATDNHLIPHLDTKPSYAHRYKGGNIDQPTGTPEDLGYYVRYKDGYESWSPTHAFEDGYALANITASEAPVPKRVVNLTFGQAIEALKSGDRVAREGWNSKDMWIVLMTGMKLPPYNDQTTERKVNDRTAKWIGRDTPLETLPYLAMWTADKKWLPGWLASQTDMLAEDWQILD